MSYWRLFYHITFAVKNREPLISSAIQPAIFRAITAKTAELNAIVHAIGGIEDHVHLAVSIPPKISLADFIGQVKGYSSHFINHTASPDSRFAWQEDYGVVSFGEKQLPVVVAYIHNQSAHHQQNTGFDGLERTDELPDKPAKIGEDSPIYETAPEIDSPI